MRPDRAACSQRRGRVVVLAVLVAFWSLPADAQVDLSGLWTPVSRNQDGATVCTATWTNIVRGV